MQNEIMNKVEQFSKKPINKLMSKLQNDDFLKKQPSFRIRKKPTLNSQGGSNGNNNAGAIDIAQLNRQILENQANNPLLQIQQSQICNHANNAIQLQSNYSPEQMQMNQMEQIGNHTQTQAQTQSQNKLNLTTVISLEHCKSMLNQLLKHRLFIATMIILTAYSLIGEYLRILSSHGATDSLFFSLAQLCMVVFAFELIIATVVKQHPFFGFYFLFDLIAIGFMVFDIKWIVGDGSQIGSQYHYYYIAQLIKIARLMRLIKLYKHIKQALEHSNSKHQQSAVTADEEENSVYDIDHAQFHHWQHKSKSNQHSALPPLNHLKSSHQPRISPIFTAKHCLNANSESDQNQIQNQNQSQNEFDLFKLSNQNNKNKNDSEQEKEKVKNEDNLHGNLKQSEKISLVEADSIRQASFKKSKFRFQRNQLQNDKSDVTTNQSIAQEQEDQQEQKEQQGQDKQKYNQGQQKDSPEKSTLIEADTVRQASFKKSKFRFQKNQFANQQIDKTDDQKNQLIELQQSQQVQQVQIQSQQQQQVNSPLIQHYPYFLKNSQQMTKAETKKRIQRKETKLGKKMSDLTTKRMIIIIFVLLVGLVAFTYESYVGARCEQESGLHSILQWVYDINSVQFKLALQVYINAFQSETESQSSYNYSNLNQKLNLNINNYQEHNDANPTLRFLQLNGIMLYQMNNLNAVNQRYDDILQVTASSTQNQNQNQNYSQNQSQPEMTLLASFDITKRNQKVALLDLFRVVFIFLILVAGAVIFTKDARELIFMPLEKMLEKIKQIGRNPLLAVEIQEKQSLQDMKEKNKMFNTTTNANANTKPQEQVYETTILETTIIKIGTLLALGFGEAGSGIVAQNMENCAGEISTGITGKKVIAIFGFCDIRNFTDSTEVLQENVLVFVNEIAEIVHGTVDAFNGSANRNIGDAFLLVWKYPQQFVLSQESNSKVTLSLNDCNAVRQITDLSVTCFAKILGLTRLSQKLKKYSQNIALNQRMPNYQVKMGFGLHVGEAIEGAIGSKYKIDASYISPNVIMASRLEAATKQYGVPLLISGDVYNLCTNSMQSALRLIDRVMPNKKGETKPIDLYTCDLDLNNIIKHYDPTFELESDKFHRFTKDQIKIIRYKNRLLKKKYFEKILLNQFDVFNVYFSGTKEKEIYHMRSTFNNNFKNAFKLGFQAYLDGNYNEALANLQIADSLHPNGTDGPSTSLIHYITLNKEMFQDNKWPGYRQFNL